MDSKQDTFNETVSSLLERKVRGWLSGVIEDMRRSSPVQQWLDSLPSEDANSQEATLNGKKDEDDSDTAENKAEESITENTVIETQNDLQEDKSLEVPEQKDLLKRKSLESGVLNDQLKNKSKLQRDHSIQSEGYIPRLKNPLLRDHSLQSDGSGSSGSSVLNVLGARKVDAESVLLALGFGPSEKQQKLQRIPDRFLVPSKLKGISTEDFIKNEQHSMKMHDCGVFGYRGLTEHCTPVCRFMKPVPSNYGPYQVPQIAVQESPCSTVDNCS
ncbi:protein TESPA1 isoform X2 [Pieris napi]|uniref:protein TESPA1 isoform X2 n=1 Tax=Pieris napi TaxID=78633 RepID=UPI001FBAA6E3|nr:protein TESPA1 isoform X2 [Pieris napi]